MAAAAHETLPYSKQTSPPIPKTYLKQTQNTPAPYTPTTPSHLEHGQEALLVPLELAVLPHQAEQVVGTELGLCTKGGMRVC